MAHLAQSMKLPHALLVALVPVLVATAQEVPPPAGSPAPEAAVTPAQPPAPAPVPVVAPEPAPPVTVKPAIPVPPVKTFTEGEVLKREMALKKQMMMVGMGAGVLGILIGMMIGRKTAPRVVSRRY